ncbi:MAG: gamma carbonic anhydrase family protein, partial [Bacillota bacterium]
MSIHTYKDKTPDIPETSHVFEGAQVVGDVRLGKNVGIWFNSVVRADMAPITIGDNTNVQDGAVIHTDLDEPTVIGRNVTIGHSAIIHAATVEDNALIGMHSTILNGATVEEGALVAAGTVVPPGKTVPSGSLALGSPMKIIRKLSETEL